MPAPWLSDAEARLRDAGVDSPRHDAVALAARAAGITHGAVVGLSEKPDGFDELIARRARRVPLQHLTGLVAFRHVDVRVGPGVLVPRPETEVVAGEAILAARRARALGVPAPLVVDLGTGSGAIACAVAQEAPGCRVHAVDDDAEALRWARDNVERWRDAHPDNPSTIAVHQEDLRQAALPGGVLADVAGQVDVVVSNPPYVAAAVTQPEALHDPPQALYAAGEDPASLVLAVLDAAAVLLRAGGGVVVEHAEEQAERVLAAALDRGFDECRTGRDLTGRPRYLAAIAAGAS
jgi:release factor glutamine methyltransferase